MMTVVSKRQRSVDTDGQCEPSASTKWQAMARVATGMARMRAVLVLMGAKIRHGVALQLSAEAEAADQTYLQLYMKQWRVRTAQDMTKVKVSATVTMAIVKLKMQ